VKITCRRGYVLNDDGACDKIEVNKPTVKREEPKPRREPSERAKADAAPANPQASGQTICTAQGCRPVQRGCRIEQPKIGHGGPSSLEICN
jgi:hypothetical protein